MSIRWLPLALLAGALMTSSGCSIAMALSGTPEPNFDAFEIGSSRQMVEIQLGRPIASEPFDDGQTRDTYEFEIGNSPNGHRAMMNLYIDLATFFLYEIPDTVIEALMGEKKNTTVVYDARGRVLAIEGYAPPGPSPTHQDAIEAQKPFDSRPRSNP